MTTEIIITICALLLISYVFDLTSAKTKVPSVILLLILGFGVRQVSEFIGIQIPDLTPLLPIFGTIGLILIVLEGSLELDFNKSKTPLIKKSFFVAFFPLLALAFILAYLFQYYEIASFKVTLTNAIPLCIISSSIAIPSAKSLTSFNKEFIIYESSLSDIIGVLFFNFVALNESFGLATFGQFGIEIIIITVVSFVATIVLAFLLSKIDHQIKFAPIIIIVILIYAISKIYHLPGLIFILFFGLFLGNLNELKRFKWIEKLKPDDLNKEVHKFKELTIEGTFLVRVTFFLLFGYLIQTNEILNPDTFIWAVGIVVAIFALRAVQFLISKVPLSPLLFIAPRGLITILLFLSIDPTQSISLVNKSLIIQVILLTAIIMMIGLLTNKTDPDKVKEE